MNPEALRARMAQIVEEMRSLSTAPDDADETWEMGEEALKRFDELDTESRDIGAKLEAAQARAEALTRSTALLDGDDRGTERDHAVERGVPNINTRTGSDPYDLSTLRFDVTPADIKARARAAIESDNATEDWAREAATKTIDNVRDTGGVANLALHTGSPAYRSAFAKLVAGQDWAMSDAERSAVARAQAVGSGGAGAFAVPFTLDPTVVLTNDSSINPMRNIARVVQTTTQSWNGVTSAGATASWDDEAAEVSDDAITLVQPQIPVHKMQVFLPFSVEIEGDWAGMGSDLRNVMVDARDNLEAVAHWKGTGSGQPTGLEVELDGGASEIDPATGETFAAADVYNLQRLLPPRYRMNSDQPTWAMALGTANTIRQFDTNGGGNFWTSLGNGAPERLLGWRHVEASAIDDAYDIDASADEDNFILFVGDFSRYVIVDRVGMTVELVPHLFGSNQRPTGQRGLVGWLRTGAESIDDNAFRVLSIPTAS